MNSIEKYPMVFIAFSNKYIYIPESMKIEFNTELLSFKEGSWLKKLIQSHPNGPFIYGVI